MTERLAAVIGLIDDANGRDPDLAENGNGKPVPAALLYGQHMSAALEALDTEASEFLRIACRAQHLERWLLPRSTFPQTKAGYHAWRNEQKKRHAERVSELMAATGYDEVERQRVASLVRKEGIKRDAEAQTLEDAACLVFLQYHAEAFAAGREQDQIIDILRKTWQKMSARGHEAALALPLTQPIRAAIAMALDGETRGASAHS